MKSIYRHFQKKLVDQIQNSQIFNIYPCLDWRPKLYLITWKSQWPQILPYFLHTGNLYFLNSSFRIPLKRLKHFTFRLIAATDWGLYQLKYILCSSKFRVLVSSDEWRYARKLHKIVSIFPVDLASNIKKHSDGEFEIFVQGNECMCVPFVYQSFAMENTPSVWQTSKRLGSESWMPLKLKGDEIMVRFKKGIVDPCNLCKHT